MEKVKAFRETLGVKLEDAKHYVDKQKAQWKRPPNDSSETTIYKSRKIKDVAKSAVQNRRPLVIKHEDSVPFELLYAQLNDKGRVSNDDFLAQARLALQTSGVEDYDQTSSRSAIPISRMYRLFYTGYLELENGFVRTSDGSYYIACIADLGVCTGEMFEWWLLFCDSSERFRWSHPECNLSLRWDEQFYAKQAIDRHEGYHIGHKLYIKLMRNFLEYEFEIEFIDPREYVHMHEYENEEAKVTSFVVARINMKILGVFVYIGTIAIMVRSTEGINEIRIRLWLGVKTIVRSNSKMHSFFATLANTTTGRHIFYTENHAKIIHDYLNGSIFCIRTFLPGLFSQRVRFYKMNMIPGQYEAEYRDPDSISDTSSAHSSSVLTDGDNRKSHGFRISEYGRDKQDVERHVSVYHVPKVFKPVDVVNREHLGEMIAAQAMKKGKEEEEIKLPTDVLQEKMKALQSKVSEDIKNKTSALLSNPAGLIGDVTKDSVTAAAQLSIDATKKAKEINDLAMKKMMKTLKGDKINVPKGAGQQSQMEIRFAEGLANKKAAAIEQQVELESRHIATSEEDSTGKQKWSMSNLFRTKKYGELDTSLDTKSSGICIHERQELVCVVCKREKLKDFGSEKVCTEIDDAGSAHHTVEGAISINLASQQEADVSIAGHSNEELPEVDQSVMKEPEAELELHASTETRTEDTTKLVPEQEQELEQDAFKNRAPHPLNPKIPQGRKLGKFKIHKKVKEGEDGEEIEVTKVHHRTAAHEREAPQNLEGALDKMTHRAFGNTFQKNFFRVNIEKRCIEYAKTMDILEGRRENVTPGTIVFSAISGIKIDESNCSCFSILVPDGDGVFEYQLRASDNEEATRWKMGLEEWQGYFMYIDSKKKLWIRGGTDGP